MADAGAASNGSSAEGRSDARHFCIVGGGIIGIATAFHLAQHPSRHRARISLFETSLSIAPGASSKSGGFMASDWHGPETEHLGELSYNLHAQLAAQHDGGAQWEYRTLNTYSADIKADGSPPRKRKPIDELAWVNRAVLEGKPKVIGDETSTAQVTPARFAEFLSDLMQERHGVELHLGTAVRAVSFDAEDRVIGVHISQRDGERKLIEVTDVIVCAGPWTGEFMKVAVPPESPLHKLEFVRSAGEITGMRAHSAIIKGARGTQNEALFTTMSYTDSRGSHKAGSPEFYTRANGTVYVCGATDGLALPKTVDDVVPEPRLIQKLIEQTAVVSPQVFGPDAHVQARQACYMPMSNRTDNPILNYSARHRFGVAAGHSCWGITLSMGTGKVMAELILDGKATSADISLLDGAIHD